MSRSLAIALATVALLAACKNRSNRPGDTLACAPGETLRIGCTGAVGSVCTGDPAMLACDGSVTPAACTDTNAIASNDDGVAGSPCPLVTTTCPASGRITVQIRGTTPTTAFECYWDIVHDGRTSDAGPGETF